MQYYFALIVGATLVALAASIPGSLNIDYATRPIATSPSLFGIFFEEINHAGEGGLYAELVQDRSMDAFWQWQNSQPGNISLYSSLKSTATSMWLRHCDYVLQATSDGKSAAADDSFAILDSGNGLVSIEAYNFPGMYLMPQSDGSVHLLSPGKTNPALWTIETQNNRATIRSSGGYITITNSSGTCSGNNAVVLSPTVQEQSYFQIEPAEIASNVAWLSTNGSRVRAVNNTTPINSNNSISLQVDISDARGAVINTGFWGMNIESGKIYDLTLFARSTNITSITIELINSNGSAVLASANVGQIGPNWSNFSTSLRATQSSTQGQLKIYASSTGTLFLDVVSLFPHDVIAAGHVFRLDLLNALQAVKPAFMRFPGGCYVEGNILADSFRWKPSVGPIETRPGHLNDVWGYWSTDGLGYYEYLLLCELIGARPVWVINNGVSHQQSVATKDIMARVQEAIDSVEFAQGDPKTSYWASVRASMGHPAPFKLFALAIGNEDCGKPDYTGNYNAFFAALRELYPDLRLIANCDMGSDAPTDLADYHIYTSFEDFTTNFNRTFNNMPRATTPYQFNSEYAVTQDAGNGNLRAAVGEAAWMTGIEINSDLVQMASYAPLFVNNNDRRWNPDAIVYDSYRMYGTPSYWVQVMFSITGNHGGPLLSSYVDKTSSLAASVTCDSDDCANIIIKAVNFGNNQLELQISVSNLGPRKLASTAATNVLTSGSLDDENSLDNPTRIVPVNGTAKVTGSTFVYNMPPISIHTLVIPTSR